MIRRHLIKGEMMDNRIPMRHSSVYTDWVRGTALQAAATALSGRATAPTGEDIVSLARELESFLDVRTNEERRGILKRSPGEIRM